MQLALNIDPNNITASFERIADDLMNKFVLKTNENTYRIAEIEFYFQDANHHNDTYTHGHALQQQTGKWYVHASGIDITIGSSQAKGGILIRALYRLDGTMEENERYVYGPINSLMELTRNLGNVFEASNFCLFLAAKEGLEKQPIIAAPRVGLNEAKNPDMYDKLYRFLIFPKLKHAEKTRIAEAMQKSGKTEEEIKEIWG